jgi:hypothetical protein
VTVMIGAWQVEIDSKLAREADIELVKEADTE